MSPLKGCQAGDPLVCYHTHELAILRPFPFKLHLAIALGEKRVITADTNIGAGVKSSASLANKNIAGNNQLAAILFHAQSFGL